MTVISTTTDADTGDTGTGTANTEQVQDDSSKACQVIEVWKRSQRCERHQGHIQHQLKTKLSTLRSYENIKGLDSEKITQIVNLLYINKTRHEDVDTLLDNTYICTFCADELKGNMDVALGVFNRLSVIDTPPCIRELNASQRGLIKHCVTSISVVGFGQVSNKSRPPNELNSVLKGRIAYLTVDVTANATFLPENFFNVDSIVLLVGAQPMSKQKIWTSV